ncbi:hypothetical protein [Nocardia sp. NPDC057030]|uniref:hypothetical protein n=1 Tax=unclassified Nocardia TaxID=2637762 RepID=UPI003642751B
MTAEEHYERALKLLPETGFESNDKLCIAVAQVHAELARYRLAAEDRCSLEHVARIAECLVSNPPESELHTIGKELSAIVGAP